MTPYRQATAIEYLPGRVVVSCCNGRLWKGLRAGGAALIEIDINALTITNIICVDQVGRDVHGITGICRYQDDILATLQGSGPCRIGLFNPSGKLVNIINTSEVVRPHSIAFHNRSIYVVSSGKDSLFAIPESAIMLQNRDCSVDQLIWSFYKQARCVHVNSLCIAPLGGVYISAFGSLEPLSRANRGFVVNTEQNQVIATGLSEPHSLVYCNGSFLICESGEGRVRNLAGAKLNVSEGYVRGLAASQTLLLVGVSAVRDRSASGGAVTLGERQDGSKGAEVIVYSWNSPDLTSAREIARFDLGKWAREIYDVVWWG